jgi:hypothetical protein
VRGLRAWPCSHRNLSGESGVVAYDIRPRSISVAFLDGRRYVYTYRSAGQERVEQMKNLARDGRGLSGFIAQNARDLFSKRF